MLHDLRLSHGQHIFQLDTLLLSTSFILILEVKNIVGTLFFDTDFHQLIRTQDDQEEAFPDPHLQIRRQQQQLKMWLTKHKLPDIPIESLVVIGNSQSIVRTTSNRILPRVIRRESIPFKIKELEKNYRINRHSDKDIKRAIRLLKRMHTPQERSVLTQFQLTIEEIKRGVLCPRCNYLPLRRIPAMWHCLACNQKTRTAHIDALKDYSLLISETITSAEARAFFRDKR